MFLLLLCLKTTSLISPLKLLDVLNYQGSNEIKLLFPITNTSSFIPPSFTDDCCTILIGTLNFIEFKISSSGFEVESCDSLITFYFDGDFVFLLFFFAREFTFIGVDKLVLISSSILIHVEFC
jgi:hypothetical protein